MDLNKIWIDFECPECNYQDQVQLVDIKCEKRIFCNNCKSSIHLIDIDASSYVAIRNINKALDDLNDVFKNIQ